MPGISYKTAWYLCHRIRAAMVESDPEPLSGVVEVDETVIGGKQHSKHRTRLEASRERLQNKTVVMGAVERGGDVRLRVVPSARKHVVKRFLADVAGDDVEAIYTDELRSYHKLSRKHLPAYLGEFEWRFNNRENPHLFRDTLRLVGSDALPYAKLGR